MHDSIIVGITAIVLILAATASAETKPQPYAVKSAADDKQLALVPDRVHLDGMIGQRILLSESARLLNVNETELLAGFRKRPGKQDWIGEHVGKFLHAATLAWVYTGDAKLREKIDRVAAELIKCQDADGYLGTYVPEKHWTSWDVWVHKYDLIGLLTYHQYTGDKAALDACRKIGDLLCNTFGQGKRDLIASGTHVGMAATSVLEPMVMLYRLTGEKKYLDFCDYIVGTWEQKNGPHIVSALTELKQVNRTANGKAYEMLSNLVGLAELDRVKGDAKLLAPLTNAWEDIVAKRLYITGSGSQGEHWKDDYSLPNANAHACEACVTVTWMQFNLQLLRLTGESRFADELEKTAYNHLAAAQKPTGDDWCYFTELEGKKPYDRGTNCCHSSGPRGFALIPTFAAAADADGAVINFYEAGTAQVDLKDGASVKLEQTTSFPADGAVQIAVHPSKPGKFALKLRIPAWSQKTTITVDGEAVANIKPGQYAVIDREWKDGDKVEMKLDTSPRVIIGDHGNADKVAIACGPLVLALDEAVNPDLKPLFTGDAKKQAANIALPADVVSLGLKPLPADEKLRDWKGAQMFEVQATVFAPIGDRKPGDKVAVRLVPFSMAGRNGTMYQVWLPKNP